MKLCSFIVSVKTNKEHADLQNSVDMYKTVIVHVVLDGRNHVFNALPLLLVSPPLEGRVKVTVFFTVPDVLFTHSIYDQAACKKHEHNIKPNPHEVTATIFNKLSDVTLPVGKATFLECLIISRSNDSIPLITGGRCQESRLAATRFNKRITNTNFHSSIKKIHLSNAPS